MMSGENISPSELERAENIGRFNVWAGLHAAAAQDTLRLDGMRVSYAQAQNTALITLPDTRFPAVTIQYVHEKEGSPERILVAEHRVIDNPLPDDTAQVLQTTTTSLFQDGKKPNHIVNRNRLTGRGKLWTPIDHFFSPSDQLSTVALDSLFDELDGARRRFVAQRMNEIKPTERKTIAQRIGAMLGARFTK